MVEIFELSQGEIIVGFSNKNLSIGLLKLKPKKALEKHQRPVIEELTQIDGTSVIKLFNEQDKLVKEITLNEGKNLTIPVNQFHIHSNSSNKKSITLWKFRGDITKVIDDIKSKFKKI